MSPSACASGAVAATSKRNQTNRRITPNTTCRLSVLAQTPPSRTVAPRRLSSLRFAARRMRSASWRRTRNCFCAFGTTRTTSTSRVRCPHPSLWSPTLSPCLRFVLTPHRSPEPRRPSDGGAEHARRWRRRSRRVEGLGGGRRLVTRRTPVKSCATTTDGGRFVVLRGVWARSSETRY